ncbi:MAG: Crp/Fnr family transcriptional regulator [Polyangiaceae bacterium]|nr:Crp/Fnr family transcriptional regulator [Polyangiaceae bacterium]
MDVQVSNSNERALRASHLFGRFGEALVRRIATGTSRRQLVRGDYLWRAGEAARAFVVIASGLVKITRTGGEAGEDEAIIALFGPHESVGTAAALECTKYPADAVVASETAEVLWVDSEAVLQARQDPAVGAALSSALLEHTHALQEKIRIMTAGSVPRRLAVLFQHLCERFGDELEGGVTFVPVVLSRIELSHMVGARVETTIRTLSRWRKLGMIETTKTGFEVRDLDSLRAVASGRS